MHRLRLAVALSAASLLAAAPAVHSQVRSGPEGALVLTPDAVAESLAVLRQLDATVRAYPDSADAWYRRGMVAWALAARGSTPPPLRSLDWTRLGRIADTSLRRAAMTPPYRVEHKLAAGQYLASSFGPLNRTAAQVQYGQAMTRSRRMGDPFVIHDAAIAAGRLFFRFYDQSEDMGSVGIPLPETMPTTARDTARAGLAGLLGAAGNALFLKDPLDYPGELSYLRAERLFDEAASAVPYSAEAFRARAMLYAARERWRELSSMARHYVVARPQDPWGWMALALSTHRSGSVATPPIAFDSALARFSPEKRAHLDNLARILSPSDSAAFVAQSEDDRALQSRAYWLWNDPLWSIEGTEPRTEFLARLAFAELRYTSEEIAERGGDSDRGSTYVRYGPPSSGNTFKREMSLGPPYGTFQSEWRYGRAGDKVDFIGADLMRFMEPEYRKARVTVNPVRWDNMAVTRVDTMPTMVARFRADARDSVDVIVATLAPYAALEREAPVAGSALAHFWLMHPTLTPVARATARLTPTGLNAFRSRVAAASYIFRTEASVQGTRFGARSTGSIIADHDPETGFSATGFGISDILLTSNARPRIPVPTRWSDYNADLVFGAIPQEAEFSLIWENYELGNDAGSARYTVQVAIERDRSQPGRIAAGILRGLAGAVGVQRGSDRMEFTLTRSVPHSDAIVEAVTLGLGETPPGRYNLTVRIVDELTQRATDRKLVIVVED